MIRHYQAWGRMLRFAAVMALFFLGAACVQQRQAPAVSELQLAQPLDPVFAVFGGESFAVNAQTALAAAEAYRQRGLFGASASYGLAAAQEDAALWWDLADLYRQRANWPAMQMALERVLDNDPEDGQAHFELAVLLMPYDLREAYDHLAFAAAGPALGAQAAQLQELIAAVELESLPAQNARIGQALAALQRWEQAEQAFTTAVTLQPDYPEALAYLALVRAQQGKPAEQYIRQALALAQDDALVQYLLGLAWRVQGDYARAYEALQVAQTLEPQNPAFALELGNTYRLLGDYAAAEYWMQVAVDSAPDNLSFLRSLAFFYADEAFNLTGDGLTVLREAAARFPNDADLLAAYARGLYAAGAESEAEQKLLEALALSPDNPRGLYYLGLIRQAQGQQEAARSIFGQLANDAEARGFAQLARRALEQLED